MREPWETLLGQYHDHWALAEHLAGPVPDIRGIKDDERWWSLSSGEQAMILAAEAMMLINQCWLAVDEANRWRIDYALRTAVDV